MTFKNTIRIILTILTLALMSEAFAQSDTKRGITIDDLAAITDIKKVALSPDGNYVAFQTMQAHKYTNDFTVEWVIAATTPGAKPVKVADGTEAVLADNGQFWGEEIIWSPDSQWIYFIKKQDDALQIWRSSYHLPEQQQLTRNAGDIQSLKISEDGSKILFTIGRTRAEFKNLTKEAAEQGYLQEPSLYSVEGPQIPACTDGRERLVEYWRNPGDYACQLTVWAFDLEAGIERPATDDEIADFYSQEDSWNASVSQGQRLDEVKKMIAASPDGTGEAWIENENPEIYKGYLPQMIVSAARDGKNIRCPAKACRGQYIKDLWWHPNGSEIVFKIQDGKHETLNSFYGWTPGESNVRTILSNDDRFYDCDLKGVKLFCAQETWTNPRKVVSIDLNDGKISTIADVNPEFQNLEFTNIEKIFADDGYGNLAHAHLVYPKGYKKGQKYPLIITQYRSYGFLRGATGDEQPIHVYAQNGFAVLNFGMPELPSDKKPYNMETQAEMWRYAMIKGGLANAIENLVDGLVKRGIIDPKRVGISGLSTGASNTDTALLRKNYTAASTAYSNITSLWYGSPISAGGKTMDAMHGGDRLSAKGSESRRKHSIDTNAKRIDTPYLIQVADREIESTRSNFNALQAAGKPVEMYIYPDERHVKWQPAHKYIVYSRNVDWFNFWLQGIEDPDPAKAEQYLRWRELREMHEANLLKLEEREK
ncbi:MAG: Atxe2 family lasso peptide isopeptidase [Sphingomonadales bacterium]